MDISDQLLCLFTARVENRGDTYVVEVPSQEIDVGDIDAGDVYRVGIFTGELSRSPKPAEPVSQPSPASHRAPPVREGDVRDVTIEDIGDQGDGIARVERGFVIIVPDADEGEQVTVEITNVAENYAIGTVINSEDASAFV